MTWALYSGRIVREHPLNLTVQQGALCSGYDQAAHLVPCPDHFEGTDILTPDERYEIAEAVCAAWLEWARAGVRSE